ncbi:MAG TPA: tetratricopeptide repeat protein [Flavobacterium sp.]|nr:tetratricopeptide repeat protein [Flavobacterium sp.]
MRKRSFLLYTLAALGSCQLFAQQSIGFTHANTDFEKAVALFNEEQYAAAQNLFDQINNREISQEMQADCAYYIAFCAVSLNQESAAEKVNLFVDNFPTSAKQPQAYMAISNFYFKQGDYQQALNYADRVNENMVSEQNQERLYFNKAYAYFDNKNYSRAKTYFDKIKDSEYFGEQAKYYIGYMAYLKDDYQTAQDLFNEVGEKDKYAEKLGYYQADMNFKAGAFEKAIEEGLAQINKSTPEEQSELNKIIGESYFNLKKYDEALPYLLAYQGKDGKWSNTDFYQLGYVYYQQKDYQKAINEFNKIIGGTDAVAQNAYYHLGESYLISGQKPQALNAFKNASEMLFSPQIAEDAYFNYAKLSYEIGNPYQSVPEVLTNFLTAYPNSVNTSEINDLLIDAYISSKNYEAALHLLEESKTPSHRAAYQKVTFYRGLELYNEGKYLSALNLFQKSIAERSDHKMLARATYWQAEADYALNKYQDAYRNFVTFRDQLHADKTPEYKNIQYSLGYAAFKLKNFEQAAKHFSAYVNQSTSGEKKTDAYLRLADSEFMSGKYWAAAEAYNHVMTSNSSDKDYAEFQKAITYGLVGEKAKMEKALQDLIANKPQSNYADDALYELGSMYANNNQNQSAIQTLDKLVNQYASSPFVAKAILRQGLVFYNDRKNNEALQKYKQVVNDFPGTNDAVEAVQNARIIYRETGRTDEFANWVKDIDFVDISQTELDNDSYQAAEQKLAQQENQQAITFFNNYLKNYPNGIHALKAHFNLAELYFVENKQNEAIPHYNKVTETAQNEYTETAWMKLATIYLQQNKKEDAIRTLQQLENIAGNEQNKIFAQANLMKLFEETNKQQQAIAYADKVIKNNKSDNQMVLDAKIILARQAFKNDNHEEAQRLFTEIQKDAQGALAAETLYYEAYYKNKSGQFEASNQVVQKLAKDYSAHKYYGAKGLILMAKNYYGLKDSYQATYILENVITNFNQYSDVVSEAQIELDKIKTEETKRNSSIQN